MAGGALRRGIVVATTVVAGVGLPASAAVATNGHGDKGGCCHHHGGHRVDRGHPRWHWPDRSATGQAQPGPAAQWPAAQWPAAKWPAAKWPAVRRPVPKRPANRPVPAPNRPVAAAPRRIPRAVSVPVLPSIASPSSPAPTDARTPRAAEPLAVGAALESPATNGSWLALMLPAIGGAVVLGLIAAGFATRRGLSKVD